MTDRRSEFGAAVLAGAVFSFGAMPAAMAQDNDGDAAPAEKAPERQARDVFNVSYCLTKYEVEHFREMLELTPEQHETMMQMFREVRRQVFEVERPLSRAIDEMIEFTRSMPRDDPEQARANTVKLQEMLEHIQAQREQFDSFQDQVVNAFFEDLGLLLRPEQAERLDDAIRWRHRFRLLRWGMVPYTDFSVASVARAMELSVDPARFDGVDQPSLESILEEYEIELDRLLLRRVAAERAFTPGARGMGGSQSGTRRIDSQEDREKWHRSVGEVNLRLVNMQKKYIRRIAALLDPEAAAEFQAECYRKAYWYILGESKVEKEATRLLELEVLGEEQRRRVLVLLAGYSKARSVVDERWIRGLDDLIANGGARVAGAEAPILFGDPLLEGDDSDGLSDISDERSELDDHWLEQVRKLSLELGVGEEEESDG